METVAAWGPAILFYLFAAIALVAALAVVTLRNPMYGAIALLTCFLAIAVLFFMRHAEFIGVVQIFVYGGGIMVLFLFVIMLVNLHRLHESKLFADHGPMAFVLAVLLVGLLVLVVYPLRFAAPEPSPASFTAVEGTLAGNAEAVAWQLYRGYLLPFEIVSLFLLVAMIGAVVLGRRD
jgi:NADH-quinone oxidoreductase subunit J